MEREVILSGVGGQGIQVNGQLLGHAAAKEGKNALYYALFGGAQRGGVSDCIVVVSDGDITAAPLTLQPISAAICMHPNSVKKFEQWVRPGGFMFADRSVTEAEMVYQFEGGQVAGKGTGQGVERTDIGLLSLPASRIAYEELGSQLVATLVAVGAFLEYTGLLKLETANDALKEAIRPGRHKFIPISIKALERGADAVRRGEAQWRNQSAVKLWGATAQARAA